MGYTSKFMQEMESLGKVSPSKSFTKTSQPEETQWKSKFFQQGGHLGNKVDYAPKEMVEGVKKQQTTQTPEQKIYYGEDTISQFYDNSPNGALYSQMFEYPEEVRNRMAQTQVQRLEQKMQKAELELKTVQARENVMATRAQELNVIAGNVENLRLQYEQTGDEVKRNAYLMATQRYNEMVEEYNANLEKLQKDQKAYDNYNQAYANYERSRLTYEQRLADQKERDEKLAEAQREQLQKLAKEDPDAWLQATNPDGRQISRMLDQLERQRIQENERWAAVIEESGGMNWQTMTDEERKENEAKLAEHREIKDAIKKRIAAVEALREERLRAEAKEKLWNSTGEEFVARAGSAIAAGAWGGLAGLAGVVDEIFNVSEYVVGTTLGNVADMLGSESLKKTAEEWTQASKEFETAEDIRGQSQYYADQATSRAGQVDAWILNNLQSIGGMMFDMAAMGGATAGMGTAAVEASGLTTGKIMALRAGGNGILDAAKKGYSGTEQILLGVATGALEYVSEKMFGGNPIYDADGGFVTNALAKLIQNPKILRLMYSKGFDIASEGLEEVFVEFLQPVAEGVITSSDIDWASGEDLLSAFAGGIFLSLAGQGAQVMATELSGAGRAQRQAIREMGATIQNADAVQDLVLEGMAAQDGTRAYELAVQLQKKLDGGQKISTKEIGNLLFANQEAIEAGQLKENTEVEPDKNAPQGALTDPERGFYGIRIRKTEDGRNGYRLVHVLPDGTVTPLGEQTNDLLAAKTAAEVKGLNIRHIGSEQALSETAMAMNYEESSEAAAEPVEPEYESKTATVAENTTAAELEELPWDGNGLSWAGNDATNENIEPAIEQPAAGGIQWAGNEYEEGAANNGTEQKERTESRGLGQNADQRRPAGRTNGRAGTGTQTGRAADVIRRSGEANRIRSYAASAKLERRSLKELGLPNGADGKILRVIPRGADPAVDRAIEIVENAGMRCVPVSGSMFVNTPAGEQRMLGIYYKGAVYLQVDSVEATAEETAKHEVFHNRAAKDPKLVKRLIDYLYTHYTQDEFGARFNKYYEQYKGTYAYENEDQLREMIWGEFLADAYAEYSRYGDPELDGLSEVAQEEAWAGNENKNAAQELSRKVTENGSLAETTSAASGEIIEQRGEDVNARFSSARGEGKISVSMTDAERTEILKNKIIVPAEYTGQAESSIEINGEDLKSGKMRLVKRALVKIGEEFQVFHSYDIRDAEVSIQLSKNNLRESVSKDTSPEEIAKLLPVLGDALENAVGIEQHSNRYFYDNNTVMFENLVGGFTEKEYFVPVRFELRHDVSGKATLYVIVDQEQIPMKKIKAEVANTARAQNALSTVSRSASEFRLSEVVPFVKGGDLLRYLPDPMLTDEQKKTKWEAVAETIVRTNNKNDRHYRKAIEGGNVRAADGMVKAAAQAAGYTIRAYHGTGRADRVGNVFRPDRATSGPMAFFTSDPNIAANYARDKADTSLAYDEEYADYYSQFRVKKYGKSIKVQDLWRTMPFAEKQRIKEAGKHITLDDEAENIIWDDDATHGLGNWDAYTLNMHKGNAIEALIDCWLESGELYGNEGDFIRVLELAGIKGVEYRDPDARYEKVYDTFLRIRDPFDTTEVDNVFANGFEEWYSQQPDGLYDRDSAGADMWDKNSQTAESFLERLRFDIEAGTSHAWTSIPDSVTDYLKYLGHDGIKDTGGKGGGESHTVWIPFSSEQVKSADTITYDDNGNVVPISERFNDEKVDIRFSASSEDRARQKAEREIARGIGEIMSMPRSAVQQLQKGLVREIMEEYQATGDLSTDKLQETVATAFAQGLVVNNEYYETYKHVKDYLRTTPVTISEQDQADIADFTQFKKRAFGTLRIVKQGGTPVDVAYQEVQGMAPGLLKPEKTHPADQLMQLYEVAREIRRVETPLERAMGEESDQFYEWAEQKISNLVDRALTKYADSVSYKQQPETKPATRTYPSYEPDNYDFRAHERMYNYGQLDYYGMPEPGSGVVQEDYIQPEGSELEWAGQMRTGNWVRDQEREKDEGRFEERTVESEDEEGQFVVDEFVPEPVAEEELTEEERARRGTVREWIQYVLRDGVTPEEFSERMKNSTRGPLRGGAKTLVERMEETARQRRGDGVNLHRDPEMSDAEYEFLNAAWQNRQRAEQDGKSLTVDELIIPKNAFTSTPAMDKLGIKIDGSVTRYRETSMLIGYDKAAEQVQRNFNKRLKKLKATKQEMDLAKMIVAGSITPEMLNADQVNLNVVTELADYLWAIESFDADRIHQRRAEIDVNNMRIAKELLRDSDEYQPQLKGMLESFTKIVMNERTPERIMKQIFGQYQGNRLYETYFRPVWVNGAEMYRFENRMKKRVETFEDQTGTKRPLTELEREYVQRLMETEAVTERMKRLDPDSRERVEAAASNIRNGMAYLDAVREQNIGKNDENGGVVQAYVDYMRTVEVVKTMDQTILKNAVAEYRKIYNEMYAAINDFLVSHGYKPIGFIEGYAPHFQKAEVQNGLRAALKTLGVTNEKVDELPVEIAGRTADFRPNLKWNPHLKSRVGNKTDYDVQLGFERYLHYAAEIFYHTDDVMRIRQAVNYMRSQYSAAEVHAAIEDAQVDAFKDVEWKREFLIKKEVLKPQEEKTASEINQAYMAYVSGLFESAKPENLRKYSELVTWMDNYANIVAGKQSMADRGIEYGGGRNILNFGTKLMRAFSSANVAGNLSSVLNQSAQLPLLRTELGKGYLLQAAKDLKNGTVEKESFADRSDFLTDKRGVDKLTVDNTEKIISTLFKPAEMADRLMSMLAVRGRYLKALDEGKTPEEALRIADDFGRRIMGSRMRGARPLGFESKTVVNQMLHVFQTEAANTFDYMFLSDMPEAVKQIYKAKGKKAGNRYVAAMATTYLISAFILNSLTDELYGGSPAPYDIIGWLLNFVAGGWGVDDDEFLKIIVDNGSERLFGMRPFETRRPGDPTGLQWAGAMEDLSYNILGDVPYLRNVMGMAGLGDQSLPTVGINEMLEAAKHAGKTVVEQALYGKKETGLTWAGAVAEVAEDIGEIGVQIIPGGRQIKKTVQGIGSIVRGGKYSGYGENTRLLYPVDRNAWNAVRAALFGPTALDETDEYYAGGKALTAGQTKIAKTLKKQGVDIEDTYLLYQVFSDINSEVGKEKITSTQARIRKRDAIAGMDLDDEQKLNVYLETMAADRDAAAEKYAPLMEAGVSWQQLTDLDNMYVSLGEDADGDGEPDLDSVERGVAKRNAIAALDLSDYQKLEIFDRYHLDREAKNYETTRSELEAMLDAGLSWEEITEAHNTYARLNADEDMNATQKATAYAKWTDQQGWSDEQKAAVKNRYTFWQMIPAEASSYEKFTGVGLEPEAADYVVSVLADLEPEDGRETVNDVQKIEAIAGSELEQSDMNAAIRQMLSEKQAAIFDDLIANGLTVKQYAQYRRAVYGLESDKDANGNAISGSKKKKVLNAINALKITNRLKDALYFASGYGEGTLDDAPWH